MATDFCGGAFQPNFAKKTTENDQSSNACQSFRINVKDVKPFRTDVSFNVFFRKLIGRSRISHTILKVSRERG